MRTFFFGSRPQAARRLMALGAAAILSFATAIAPIPVQAQANVRLHEGQQSIPVFALGTLESREGEAKLEFLRRTGRVLEQYTKATNLEACGIIAEHKSLPEGSAGKWSVPLVTQQSHIACAAVLALPEGATYTGETIHSHPQFHERRYRVNEADSALLPITSKQKVRAGQLVNAPRHREGQTFSSKDFDAGPGWLVDHGVLYYQNGTGRVASHGAVFNEAFLVAGIPDELPVPRIPGVLSGGIALIDLVAVGGFHPFPEKREVLDTSIAVASATAPQAKP